ncbi:MAG: HAMP domain-containing sensor histidine kinase [Angelakisella sp.]
MVHTSQKSNLPIESLTEMEYVDSYDFMLSRRDIAAALYWNYDISKLYNIENLPTLYYRAEYADGSVNTNVAGKDAEFFKSHKVHALYKTLPTGEWQELSVSQEQRSMPPNTIAYGNVQLFFDNQHGFSRSYTDSVSPTAKSFALPMPEDIPDAVKWQIYGNDSWVDHSFGSVTVESYTTTIPTTTEELSEQEIERQYQAWLLENPIPTATIYYAFDDASLAGFELFWQQCRHYYLGQIGLLLGLFAVAALSALWLLIVCGRRSSDDELHLCFIDHMWTEAGLFSLFVFIVGFIGIAVVGMEGLIYSNLFSDRIMSSLYCVGLTLLAMAVLVWLLSMVRLLKAKCFLTNSLTWKLFYWCSLPFKKAYALLRSCFDERSFKAYPLTEALQKRQMVFLGTLGGVLLFALFVSLATGSSAAFAALLLSGVVLGCIAYWHITGNLKTYKEINAGFNESFEEQMKSERTKTALITNVSHDLKTPLTSIITYLDLLEKEELSDSARDYVTVLTQKSQRLKSIVSDLFDLSKSASGNIPLDMEVLDLRRLIEQTMADMRDNIEDSGLTIKTTLPEGEVNIYADGKKLYRVFQNVIGNALKYSMPGTRVFITLENENGMATATLKNTAGYEMDFTADEVLQRFARGDKSRTGDGSGLGLSIAESFTGACGGKFRVELDGDLFKVIISFAEMT